MSQEPTRHPSPAPKPPSPPAKAKRRRLVGPRFPEPFGDIDVNCCKNPACGAGFGRPALPKADRGRGKRDGYARYRRSMDEDHVLRCEGTPGAPGCGRDTAVKSNRAVAEELERISAYLEPAPVACPQVGCANFRVPGRSGDGRYRAHGRLPSGAVRYWCRGCRTAFTVGAPPRSQLKSHENRTLFLLLVNKAPLRAAARVAGLAPQTVYDKIDFLHRQCLAFAAARERQLPGMAFRRLWISSDRQDYVVNWTNRLDKKNVALTAVGSAENRTGYVFAMNLAYDPAPDPEIMRERAEAVGDFDPLLPGTAWRRYARLWLPGDDAATRARKARKRRSPAPPPEPAGESDAPFPIFNADGTERFEPVRKLPVRGMQVRWEYTAHAHFRLLRRLLAGAARIRFFFDGDDGLKNGCLATFAEDILMRRVDAFVVDFDKTLTQDQKIWRVARARRHADKIRSALGADWPLWKVRLFLLTLEICRRERRNDRWVHDYIDSINEPDKRILHLTELDGHDPEYLTRLGFIYMRASLHGIDRFFMKCRRMVMMLERPIPSAANAGKLWHGYTAYNPRILQKLLDIYRVYYNYCDVGEDKRTPAMRLGLAKSPVKVERIIYFGRKGA